MSDLPLVIQGGMGVAVSGWRLANAVARAGQLGVVSGVALDAVVARRLQLGDEGGHLRRALAAFPFPAVAERILARYFVDGGIPPGTAFRPVPRLGLRPHPQRDELIVAGSFAEVFLAKEGHPGTVGLNLLEKVQLATPAAVYGAMLAGVDVVLVGAGIPGQIPALLRELAAGRAGEIDVTVEGAGGGARHTVALDPAARFGAAPVLAVPRFHAIVSTHVLAAYLARDQVTRPDGFVIETPVAGGHSAPPRGRPLVASPREVVYGARDEIDVAKVAAVGLPFWLAGGYALPERLEQARLAGAAGVQVGTVFALCRESGLRPDVRSRLVDDVVSGRLAVRNDGLASPTGFPFKVAELAGTVGDDAVFAARQRRCDLGYLRVPYLRDNGAVGYRCPAEPVEAYVAKGGAVEDTVGRRCLCNGLTSVVGLGQTRADGTEVLVEPPLVTLGQDLEAVRRLVAVSGRDFGAADVVAHLLRR